jgi:hypothetical protein
MGGVPKAFSRLSRDHPVKQRVEIGVRRIGNLLLGALA